jgi:hypothetical protein
MSQTAKANEPSMEEILASIRRIIADDEPPKAAPAARAVEPVPAPVADEAPKSQDDIDALLAGFDDEPEPPPPPPPVVKAAPPPPAVREPEIFELSRADAVPERVGMIRPIAQRADVEFMDQPSPPPPAPPPPAPAAVVPGPSLISSETHAAVGAAFGSLANTMLSGNGRTIDDLVKDMLRPMLKNWLDDNLPQLVERLVRAEIERVSRGGSGR